MRRRRKANCWFVFVRCALDQHAEFKMNECIKKYLKALGVEQYNEFRFNAYVTGDHEKERFDEFLVSLKSDDNLVVFNFDVFANDAFRAAEVLLDLQGRGVKIHSASHGARLETVVDIEAIKSSYRFMKNLSSSVIKRRSREGASKRRSKLYTLGRPKGSTGPRKLDQYAESVKEQVEEGESIAALADEYGVCWKTMRDFCADKGYLI